MDARGFTLVEVLIATAITALVAAAAFALLDGGMTVHERGFEMGLRAQGMATATTILRSDLARADSVVHAGPDSLQLLLNDGRRVAWAARPRSQGVAVFRSIDAGSGFQERPLRPLVELDDAPSSPASLDFATTTGGLVEATFSDTEGTLRVEAAPWRRP